MIHTLFSNWKQSICYDLSKHMTKEILFNIIKALYKINYTIVATVNGMGISNMDFWNELKIKISSFSPIAPVEKSTKTVHIGKTGESCHFD